MSAKKKHRPNAGQARHSNAPSRSSNAPDTAAPRAQQTPRHGPEGLSPGRLLAVRLLIAAALGLSAYLAFVSLSGSQAVGCGPDSGCDRVLASRWAYWFGIPVSAFALLVDGVLLAATFQRPSRNARLLLDGCALLIAGAALWFIGIQIGVVQSICPYCMAAHGAGLTAALLILTSPASHAGVPLPRRGPALAAILGLAALAAGQLLHAPKTFVVATLPTNSPPAATTSAPLPANPGTAALSTTPAPSSSSSPAAPTLQPRPSRLFPVYNGQFQVDVMDAPTLGAPTNPQVVVALHDYTCSHCREMHPLLKEAHKMFPNQLVIVTLPMPFDPACNPIMTRPNPKHTNACDYARLSLAVWRVAPEKHHEFDEYLFTGKYAPPVHEARAAAARLIGAARLDQALADPWIDQKIQLGVSLYTTAYRAGQGSMPQFMIGQNVAVGTLARADLFGLLARNLGLVSPATPGAP